MEVRKIYINDTAQNNVITLETDATTFGELKTAAIAAGVDVNGKDWLEGITKTSPTDDSSLLPTNVTYKGNVTNDLVFVLTNTNKRIKSGVYSRTEAYQKIRERGLQGYIKTVYGKNFTQCTTRLLNEIIAAFPVVHQVSTTAECESLSATCPIANSVIKSIAVFMHNLYKEDESFKNALSKEIKALEDKENKTPTPLNISLEEIKEMC
jgi:hypothetical protein